MIELPAVVVALTAFMGTPALPPAAEPISLVEPADMGTWASVLQPGLDTTLIFVPGGHSPIPVGVTISRCPYPPAHDVEQTISPTLIFSETFPGFPTCWQPVSCRVGYDLPFSMPPSPRPPRYWAPEPPKPKNKGSEFRLAWKWLRPSQEAS